MATESSSVPLRLHSGYAHPVSRIWQSNDASLAPHNLMYPLFVIDNPDEVQPINAMPGVSRMGVNKMMEHVEELVPLGLSSVLLFAVTSLPKVSCANVNNCPLINIFYTAVILIVLE